MPAQGEDGCRTGDISHETRLALAFGGEKRLASLARSHEVFVGGTEGGREEEGASDVGSCLSDEGVGDTRGRSTTGAPPAIRPWIPYPAIPYPVPSLCTNHGASRETRTIQWRGGRLTFRRSLLIFLPPTPTPPPPPPAPPSTSSTSSTLSDPPPPANPTARARPIQSGPQPGQHHVSAPEPGGRRSLLPRAPGRVVADVDCYGQDTPLLQRVGLS